MGLVNVNDMQDYFQVRQVTKMLCGKIQKHTYIKHWQCLKYN